MKFSEVLNDLITQKDMSLRKIAKECGVSASQLSKYLKGYNPTIQIAVKLANYFDCTLDYLCGLTDKEESNINKTYDLTKFVSRYKEVLKDAGLTNWKFCKKYGMNDSLIRHWQKGEVPRLYNIIFIAENLGVSIDYLIGRSDKK